MLEIPDENRSGFYRSMKTNFRVIYPGPEDTPENVSRSILKIASRYV
ncbi:MAG: hypothetical protein ACOC2H_01680 [Spirochaetota bacterium]